MPKNLRVVIPIFLLEMGMGERGRCGEEGEGKMQNQFPGELVSVRDREEGGRYEIIQTGIC